MDDWKISFLLGWPIFRCELLVSGRVPTSSNFIIFNSPQFHHFPQTEVLQSPPTCGSPQVTAEPSANKAQKAKVVARISCTPARGSRWRRVKPQKTVEEQDTKRGNMKSNDSKKKRSSIYFILCHGYSMV